MQPAIDAALALSRSHPQAPALGVLDVALRGRVGRLADSGTISPTSAFGQLISAAFDRGIAPEDWRLIDSPSSSPALVAALHDIWRDEVLAAFAARYSLEV
jgi:hypothetical protein